MIIIFFCRIDGDIGDGKKFQRSENKFEKSGDLANRFNRIFAVKDKIGAKQSTDSFSRAGSSFSKESADNMIDLENENEQIENKGN